MLPRRTALSWWTPTAAGSTSVPPTAQASLVAAAPRREEQHGLAIRRLVGDLVLTEVPAEGVEAGDVDTWEDLLSLRSHLDT